MAEIFDVDIAPLLAAAKRYEAAGSRVEGAITAGIKRVAGVADRRSERQINRLYNARIPTKAQVARFKNKSGKYRGKKGSQPAWKRSGNLKRGRTLVFPDALSAQISITGNAANYAERRHQLGVSWQPKNPALGVVRRNPFFAEAVQITSTQVQPAFKAAFMKALKGATD